MKLLFIIACSVALGAGAAAKTAEWMNAATAVFAHPGEPSGDANS